MTWLCKWRVLQLCYVVMKTAMVSTNDIIKLHNEAHGKMFLLISLGPIFHKLRTPGFDRLTMPLEGAPKLSFTTDKSLYSAPGGTQNLSYKTIYFQWLTWWNFLHFLLFSLVSFLFYAAYHHIQYFNQTRGCKEFQLCTL